MSKKRIRNGSVKTRRRAKSVVPTARLSARIPQLHYQALTLFAQTRGLNSLTEALELSLEIAFKNEAWAETFVRELELLNRVKNGVSSISLMIPDAGSEDVVIGPYDFEYQELMRLGYAPELRAYTFGDYHRIITKQKLEREEQTNGYRETETQCDRNGSLSYHDDGTDCS